MTNEELTEVETSMRNLGAQYDESTGADADSPAAEVTTAQDSGAEAAANKAGSGESARKDDGLDGRDGLNGRGADRPAEAAGQSADGAPKTNNELAKPDKPEGGPTKPESPYEQAKREKREREARAWQKIEGEKAAVKAERERLEADRRQARPAEAGPVKDERGYSAEDYERAARQFEADGDSALAQRAMTQANQLRHAQLQHQHQALAAKLHAGIEAVVEKRPEFRDPSSAAGQAVKAVLQEFPMLRQTPGGFEQAVRTLDARKSGASVPGLQAKLEALTKENQRLNKLTSLPASNPRNAGKGKNLSDLSLAEQEKALRRAASEWDGE